MKQAFGQRRCPTLLEFWILSAALLTIAGAVWLLLPVTHWPGYSGKSLISTSLGLGAIGLVLIPLAIVGLGYFGLRLWCRGRFVSGLALLWTGVLALLFINFTSHALGPFFLPANFFLLMAAISVSFLSVRRHPMRDR
ncbi:MAG: hypothetical protein HYX82_06295 [Chloroflexi bacterium]|nr:hypothetical protein [Chloroflexota bacterium]